MTISFEYRILEEKEKGQKTALDMESAVNILLDHRRDVIPDTGIIQLRATGTNQIYAVKIVAGQVGALTEIKK